MVPYSSRDRRLLLVPRGQSTSVYDHEPNSHHYARWWLQILSCYPWSCGAHKPNKPSLVGLCGGWVIGRMNFKHPFIWHPILLKVWSRHTHTHPLLFGDHQVGAEEAHAHWVVTVMAQGSPPPGSMSGCWEHPEPLKRLATIPCQMNSGGWVRDLRDKDTW